MLLLGVDTAGREGSLALVRADEAEFAVLELARLTGGAYSAQLIPALREALARHQLSKRDLEGMAVATGPGSFTGLRVGLAAVKALAETLHLPIAAVSSLEAVAAGGPAEPAGDRVALLDAGRGEIYVGEYRGGAAVPARLRERLLRLDELAEGLAAESMGGELISPDAAVVESLAARGVRVGLLPRPGADVIARLGWEKIRAAQTTPAAELEANYIRRSDAEIFSLPKLSRQSP